jgi:hypothetical protein
MFAESATPRALQCIHRAGGSSAKPFYTCNSRRPVGVGHVIYNSRNLS